MVSALQIPERRGRSDAEAGVSLVLRRRGAPDLPVPSGHGGHRVVAVGDFAAVPPRRGIVTVTHPVTHLAGLRLGSFHSVARGAPLSPLSLDATRPSRRVSVRRARPSPGLLAVNSCRAVTRRGSAKCGRIEPCLPQPKAQSGHHVERLSYLLVYGPNHSERPNHAAGPITQGLGNV